MPIAPDWTIGDLLEWIAADDARCHDDALRPLLSELAAMVSPESRGRDLAAPPTASLTQAASASPVALVRALAMQVRAEPALRTTPLREFAPQAVSTPAAPILTRPEPTTATAPEASVRRQVLHPA